MKIECVQVDIATQIDIAAIVNTVNAWLCPSDDVTGAIYCVADPVLEEEYHPLAPIKPNQVLINSVHKLLNRYVLHNLGPIYVVDKPKDEISENCYSNAIILDEKHKIDSIAFPVISTSAFGYSIEEAAVISLRTMIDLSHNLHYVKII